MRKHTYRRKGGGAVSGLLNGFLVVLGVMVAALILLAGGQVVFGKRSGALALSNLLPTPTPTPLPTATPLPTPTLAMPLPASPIPRAGPPPLGFTGRTEFGAQVHCEFDLQHNLDIAKDMGLIWVKQQVRWGDIENVPGTVDWSCLDRVVEGANQRGLKVMVSVTGAPVWTRTNALKGGRRDTLGPPDDLAVFAQFVASMLRRHRAIRAVEVWNEPNLDREWKDGLDGRRYADLLKATYVAVKAVDPAIIVISAGIAPTPSKGGSRQTYIDDRVWFGEALANGLADYADCMGAHANGPDGEGNAATGIAGDITPVIQRYRAMASMPVCVTEFGYALPVNGAAVPGFGWAMNHTEAGQAAKLRDGMSWAAQTGIVRVVVLWNLGFGGGSDDSNKLYALRDQAIQGVKVLLRR